MGGIYYGHRYYGYNRYNGYHRPQRNSNQTINDQAQISDVFIKKGNYSQTFHQKNIHILNLGLDCHPDPNQNPKSIWVLIQNLIIYILV